MINKMKFAGTALTIGLLLSSSVAFAEIGTTPDTTRGTTNTPTTVSARKACLATAKTARMVAVKTAGDVAKAAKATAKSTLAAALAQAKANTDKSAATATRKAANADYKTTWKSILATQAASVKTAYGDYAIAIKACPKK